MADDWRWVRSGAGGPAENMALDEALIRVDDARPTLRTYTWKPWTISLGYFQTVTHERVEAFRGRGLGVVRRPTGGGAIYHADELTYAFVAPAGTPDVPDDAVGAYDLVHGAIRRALHRVGTDSTVRGDDLLVSDTGVPDEFWCFYKSSEFDLVAGARKLVGSAQRRTGRGFLMHGSIPVSPNELTPEAADAGTTVDTLADLLAEELAEGLGARLAPGEMTDAELAAARDLERKRYASDRWTYRRSSSV
ncbi:MAG: biotin/lipoate A/B protein ligase family protein [Planctomycetota bacterium]